MISYQSLLLSTIVLNDFDNGYIYRMLMVNSGFIHCAYACIHRIIYYCVVTTVSCGREPVGLT